MNFRLTWILFAVALAVVALLLVTVLVDDTPSADAPLLEALAGAKEDDIDTVELLRTEPTEEKLVFARTGDRWELREPFTAKLDSFQVSAVIRDLLKLKPTTYPDLSGNLTVHGLDKPGLKVTLRRGSGTPATLNVGDTTIGGDRAVTFVTTAARPNTPVAVRRSDLASLFRPGTKDGKSWQIAKWLSDYRQKRLLAADVRDPVSDLQAVKIKQGAKELAVTHTGSGEWVFASPPNFGRVDVAGDPEPKPDTFTGLRPLLGVLTNFQVTDPADVIENPGPLDQYGLKPDDPNAVRVELQPKDGPAEVLVIGKKVDEKAVPVKYFAKLASDPAIFKVQSDRVPAISKLVADPADLRDRTLVSDLKKDNIDAIDITAGGTTVRLRKVPVGAAKQWVLYGGPTDPQIAGAATQQLLDALTKPRAAKEVLDQLNPTAFTPDEVKAEVKVWFDGTEPAPVPKEEKKDEKKDENKLPPEPKLKGDGKPAVTLLFGKKEGDLGLVRRTTPAGPPVDFKVPEPVYAQATKGRLDYINPHLKSFATNTANRLAFNRGPEPFVLVKDAKPDPDYPIGKWTFEKPDRLKGQVADAERINNELLTLLATQTASRVVAEQPAADQLKKYDLDPANPRLRVTVGLSDGPVKEIGYEFGTETEADKGQVYAKEVGRPLVFTVPAFVVDKFLNTDLRDRTLYHIDPAKVQRLKLFGYKQALGKMEPFEFERKGSDWATTKAPAGFVADPAKVNAFLQVLRAPRAVAVFPGGPKKEHGFDGATDPNPLQVTIEADGRPPIVLTLGNETDGGASYFAWCSERKEDVVTLPAAPLKPYKENPASLKK